MTARVVGFTVFALAGLLTVVQYGMTIHYGFYYDDYHFVRPYTAHEVLAAFHGPWDPSGIETAYYRPLTIALYAARFSVFGLNAPAYHILSLFLFAMAAALFAVLAMRLTGSRLAGLIGVCVFVMHPAMPYSAVAWITNQMHLTSMLVVLVGLLWWFAVRRRPGIWWAPLLVLQAAAFLIKEDGVMLLPAIVAVHTLRKYLVERDLPHVPASLLVSGVATLALLFLVRHVALSGIPVRRVPPVDAAWTNLVRGFKGPFFLVPAKRPFQPAASWFAMLLPVAAAVGWRWMSPGFRFGAASGFTIGILFDLPFVFIVKAEQLHLIAMAASLSLTAAASGLIHTARLRWQVRTPIVAAIAAGVAAMSIVTRDITRDFEPSGPLVKRADRIVQEWAAVPAELREYLAAKSAQPTGNEDSNPAQAVALVAFGLHGREIDPAGLPVRWMSGPVTDLYVGRGTRLASFRIRHEIGVFREPARLEITVNGRPTQQVALTDGNWHDVTLAFSPRNAPRISGMHHVRLTLDHAWIPARIIPDSADTRVLGLQVGAIARR